VTPHDVVVGLGANLGDRRATLEQAARGLGDLGRLITTSYLYETAPVGPPQPDCLNAAARMTFDGGLLELLERLLVLERAAGRERRVRWGPRTLDLDILWVRGETMQTSELTVPHSGLSVRPFALIPLLDVAPDATDPRSGVAYADVLARLDAASVRRTSSDRLLHLESSGARA
jgi:2-amino-4-hydroxy-6-hydroxymethyldihydropteridine diphosphokinase